MFTLVNERVASLHLWVGDRILAVVCAHKLSSSTDNPPERPWVGYLRALIGNDSDTWGGMPGLSWREKSGLGGVWSGRGEGLSVGLEKNADPSGGGGKALLAVLT